MRFPHRFFPVLIATAALVGCTGGDADRVAVYPVSGVVTMDGDPVAGATVTFSPKAGQPTAVGRTDAQGKYQLTTYESGDGAAPGEYAVLISKSDVGPVEEIAHGPDFESPAQHRAQQRGGSMLPAQYANAADTPLTATVAEGGENKIDFNLEK